MRTITTTKTKTQENKKDGRRVYRREWGWKTRLPLLNFLYLSAFGYLTLLFRWWMHWILNYFSNYFFFIFLFSLSLASVFPNIIHGSWCASVWHVEKTNKIILYILCWEFFSFVHPFIHSNNTCTKNELNHVFNLRRWIFSSFSISDKKMNLLKEEQKCAVYAFFFYLVWLKCNDTEHAVLYQIYMM